MEIGMLNFLLGLLVTALTKETYFNSNWNTNSLKNNGIDPIVRRTRYTLGVSGGRWCDKSCPKFTMVCSVRYEVFNDSQEVKSAPIVLKNTCQH